MVLSLRNVGVTYYPRLGLLRHGRFEALRNVSFNLHQGESLGIIGSNGAGKSTLLRVLGGIIRPNRGKLINYGHSVALLSLQLGFDPNLSGRENAILNALLLGFSWRQIRQKLDEIIAFSELGEFIDSPLRTYSTGMRARLGFSVAFHLDPDVLLIDEILGVGDISFQRKSRAEMERKIASDKTVVLVSHSLNDVRKLCNRAIWVERGEIKMDGKASEVVEAYQALVGEQHPTSTLSGGLTRAAL